MGLRKGAHGSGTWGHVGGHVEYGEGFEVAAHREIAEETGMDVGPMEFIAISNDVFEDGQHFITAVMRAPWISGEPEVREREYVESWEWFPFDSLPEPLFLPIQKLRDHGVRFLP